MSLQRSFVFIIEYWRAQLFHRAASGGARFGTLFRACKSAFWSGASSPKVREDWQIQYVSVFWSRSTIDTRALLAALLEKRQAASWSFRKVESIWICCTHLGRCLTKEACRREDCIVTSSSLSLARVLAKLWAPPETATDVRWGAEMGNIFHKSPSCILSPTVRANSVSMHALLAAELPFQVARRTWTSGRHAKSAARLTHVHLSGHRRAGATLGPPSGGSCALG